MDEKIIEYKTVKISKEAHEYLLNIQAQIYLDTKIKFDINQMASKAILNNISKQDYVKEVL